MKKFTPYNDNIIFLDAEFSSLDPYKGEIISLGLVKMNGDSLYIEIDYDGEMSGWVKENVVPYLTQKKVSANTARKKVKAFVGKGKPYFISYVTQFDAIFLRKLFQVGDAAHNQARFPFHWMSIDFASMLFALGIRPEDFTRNHKEFCGKFDIDTTQYQQHNALDDARLLREIYMRMVGKKI